MKKEYGISRTNRIIYWIIVAIFFIIPAIMVISSEKARGTEGLLVMAFMGLFVTYIIRGTMRKITIDDKGQITLPTFFGREVLHKEELAGYRLTNKNNIILVPLKPGAKEHLIRISIGYTEDLQEWIFTHLTDLNETEAAIKLVEVLQDSSLGINPTERKQALSRIEGYSNILLFGGTIVAALAGFIPYFYTFQLLLCALWPLLALALYKFYNGMVLLNQRKNSPLPSVDVAIVFPVIALGARILLDYSFIDYSAATRPAGMLFLILFVILVPNIYRTYDFTKASDYKELFYIVTIGIIYVYSVVFLVNGLWNRVPVSVQQVQVMEKEMSGRHHNKPTLVLSKWGPVSKQESVSVSKGIYQRTHIKSMVPVYLYEGIFGIYHYNYLEPHRAHE